MLGLIVASALTMSRRSQNRRLACAVEMSGILASYCCDSCIEGNRVCIVSSLSNRCSGCLLRNGGCSHSSAPPQSLLELSSLNSQEVTTRLELTNSINSLIDCLNRLNQIIARRDDLLASFVVPQTPCSSLDNVSGSLVPKYSRSHHNPSI